MLFSQFVEMNQQYPKIMCLKNKHVESSQTCVRQYITLVTYKFLSYCYNVREDNPVINWPSF